MRPSPLLPLALVLVLIHVLACDVSVDPPQETVWTAVLEPVGEGSTVSGQAAAISRNMVTEASILVEGLAANDTLSWGIRTGSCEEPGELVGPAAAYPELVSDGGTATADAVFNPALSSSGSYHVAAFGGDEEGGLACGELRPQ